MSRILEIGTKNYLDDLLLIKKALSHMETLVGKEIKENPRDLLVAKLGYRGLEVLENAEYQFPNETTQIIQKLFELIKSGEINESFDGGQLLALFRSIGLNIKMQTKINVEQDGKFVSLSDKLSKESSDDSDD